MNNKLYTFYGTVFLILINGLVFAGDFACFDAGNTVTNRVVQKVKSQGKVYSTRVDCLRINREQFNTITNRHKVIGENVVSMTQDENDLLDSIIADAHATTETFRVASFDNSLSIANVNDAILPKVDQAIDGISSLSDAKTFLKKLARYLLNKK